MNTDFENNNILPPLAFDEQWHCIKERMPPIGCRVRVLVAKEMVYQGDDDTGSLWIYDGQGEKGIYCWSFRMQPTD
jgi:hypothetical protein